MNFKMLLLKFTLPFIIMMCIAANASANCTKVVPEFLNQNKGTFIPGAIIDEFGYFKNPSAEYKNLSRNLRAINYHFEIDAILVVVDSKSPCVAAIPVAATKNDVTGIIAISADVFDSVRVSDKKVTNLRFAAILAHEAAHLNAGRDPSDGTRIVQGELLADKLAGEYIGILLGPFFVTELFVRSATKMRTHCEVTPLMLEISELFLSLGKVGAANQQFHGTPLQRENSFLQGLLRSREARDDDYENSGSCKPLSKNMEPRPSVELAKAIIVPKKFRGKWVKAEDLNFCDEAVEMEGIYLTNEDFGYNFYTNFCESSRFTPIGDKGLRISASCLDIEVDEFEPIDVEVYQFFEGKLSVQGSHIDQKIDLVKCDKKLK